MNMPTTTVIDELAHGQAEFIMDANEFRRRIVAFRKAYKKVKVVGTIEHGRLSIYLRGERGMSPDERAASRKAKLIDQAKKLRERLAAVNAKLRGAE